MNQNTLPKISIQHGSLSGDSILTRTCGCGQKETARVGMSQMCAYKEHGAAPESAFWHLSEVQLQTFFGHGMCSDCHAYVVGYGSTMVSA